MSLAQQRRREKKKRKKKKGLRQRKRVIPTKAGKKIVIGNKWDGNTYKEAKKKGRPL